MTAISLRELEKHLEADKPFMFPHESYDLDCDGDYIDWLYDEPTIDDSWLFDDWYDDSSFDPYPICDDFYD